MNPKLKSKAGISLIGVGFLAMLFLSTTQRINRGSARSREAVLKTDLRTMRDAIDHYTLDKKQPPQSLQDLVDGHYIRKVPVDPITHKADWVPVFGDVTLSPDRKSAGLCDVHSSSNRTSLDGSKYNEW